MENLKEPTREEMQKLVEKAQKELEERLAKMTPEEREQAEIRAKKLMEEDQARIQSLLDTAAKIAAGSTQKQKPNFCPNCGAAFNPENHKCEYCGSFIFVDDKKEFNIPESMKNEISNAPGIYVHGKLLGKDEIPLRIGLANYYTSKFLGGGKEWVRMIKSASVLV